MRVIFMDYGMFAGFGLLAIFASDGGRRVSRLPVG
jgi:hypothetical protein